MLGGNVIPEHNLVVSQIGPLHILGVLGRQNLSLKTLRVMDRSKVLRDGGRLQPIKEWRVEKNDDGDNQVISFNWIKILCGFEGAIVKRTVELYPKLNHRQSKNRGSG